MKPCVAWLTLTPSLSSGSDWTAYLHTLWLVAQDDETKTHRGGCYEHRDAIEDEMLGTQKCIKIIWF